MTSRPTTIVAGALIGAALAGTAVATPASAAVLKSRKCEPGFQWTNISQGFKQTWSDSYENTTNRPKTYTFEVSNEVTETRRIAAELEAELKANGLVFEASVRAAAGIEAVRSVRRSEKTTFPVTVPPRTRYTLRRGIVTKRLTGMTLIRLENFKPALTAWPGCDLAVARALTGRRKGKPLKFTGQALTNELRWRPTERRLR